LVWVDLMPLIFWLDPADVVETLLARCNTSTSGMLSKVRCSEPPTMVERICVGGWFWVEVWVCLRQDGDTN
jgi:hypothetical protein